MAAKRGITDEQVISAYHLRRSITGTVKELGLADGSNGRKRVRRIIESYYPKDGSPPPEIPQIPQAIRTPSELIEQASRNRTRLQQQLKAKQQSIIKINSLKPFGHALLPDQHMDAPGSNLALIYEDAKLIAKTDGLYATEVGDSIDNFILSKLHHARYEHIVTVKEAWALTEEYHRILAPKLLAAISGNHLNWTTQLGGADYLERVLRDAGVNALYDADELFFYLKAPNGAQWHYGLRHHFRGGSQYHPVHSVVRYIHSAAYRGEDVVIAGHLHVAGHSEVQVHNKMVHAVQVGSYKDRDLDDFCRERGFMSQHPWQVPMLIHFPETGRTRFFPEMRENLDYLAYLRAKK